MFTLSIISQEQTDTVNKIIDLKMKLHVVITVIGKIKDFLFILLA